MHPLLNYHASASWVRADFTFTIFHRNLFYQDFAYCSARKAIIPVAMAVIKEKFFAFLTTAAAASTAHKTTNTQEFPQNPTCIKSTLGFWVQPKPSEGLSGD